MPLINCIRCGSLFSATTSSVCPACVKLEEDEFTRAVAWLRENPGKTITALAEATGIERTRILTWIRQNRLRFMQHSEYVLCKKCGTPITSGNFCDRCKLELTHEVKQNIDEIEREKKPSHRRRDGMHYLPTDRESRAR
ncbi:MAG: hypothetical protein Kow0099_30060 [Candidatus Abyssubacteria bacterium]